VQEAQQTRQRFRGHNCHAGRMRGVGVWECMWSCACSVHLDVHPTPHMLACCAAVRSVRYIDLLWPRIATRLWCCCCYSECCQGDRSLQPHRVTGSRVETWNLENSLKHSGQVMRKNRHLLQLLYARRWLADASDHPATLSAASHRTSHPFSLVRFPRIVL
jgi:hypothetical protein